MSALDFFGLAGLIFAARVSSDKAAYSWMLIFSGTTWVILISSWVKGGAA